MQSKSVKTSKAALKQGFFSLNSDEYAILSIILFPPYFIKYSRNFNSYSIFFHFFSCALLKLQVHIQICQLLMLPGDRIKVIPFLPQIGRASCRERVCATGEGGCID